MFTRHPEVYRDLLSNLGFYLAQKKHWKIFDPNSFNICANSGASSCATADEIDFRPGTYKHFTGVTINVISEVLKASGCISVSWIFQDDKKQNI